jgi:hypothetical protein
MGIKERGLVCTMLDLRGRGSGATRGQRALLLLLQRGVSGGRLCRSKPLANVCSSFLEGKDGLGVINALFSVGLSASCIVYGGVAGAVSTGAYRVLCEAETGYGACRLAPERLFTVCMEGEGMYMVVYRSRCPRTARCEQTDKHVHTTGPREKGKGNREQQRSETEGGAERTEATPAAKKAGRGWWFGAEDTRSSTKRLSKERLGRRCAYAWEGECGADREESNGRAGRGETRRSGRGGEQARRSRCRLLSCSLSHTVNRRMGLAGGNATTFAMDGGFGVWWCAISWSRGGAEPLPPRVL